MLYNNLFRYDLGVKLCRFIMSKIIKENAKEVVGVGECSSGDDNGGILGLNVDA